MSVNPHRSLIAVAAFVVAAACGGDSADTPARQIDLAPGKAAEPQLADAPLPQPEPAKAQPRAAETKRPTPPPVVEERAVETPAPAPVAAVPTPELSLPPAPTTGSIETGASFSVIPSTKICTNTH